ncbi:MULTISPECIES: hypothetical protein [Streptosporangiaceae]|uniref:hypothetical protein n=1 Tax=Streptosporangiaceae TaxID=2004 RepID=UPI0033F2813C
MDVSTKHGPALWYVATNEAIVRLDDEADLTQLPERERVIAAALVDHARQRISTADYELMTGITKMKTPRAEQGKEAL